MKRIKKKQEIESFKKLPIDVSAFNIMIENNYLYIDKTEIIHDLITGGRFYFLSRPRRFGKSLFLSTLQEIFEGNKKLFKDLWIGKKNRYDWPIHPVIYLNFSDLTIATPEKLIDSLSWSLELIAQKYGIDLSKAPGPGSKIKQLTYELFSKNGVVILIDEYDYPLINTLKNIKIAEANREVLKNFFSVIKSLDKYLRAIYLTGVTKFSKTSIFSGLNNLNDITIDPRAAELLGYTQNEIDSYFAPYITKQAEYEDRDANAIKEEMKNWYNGYRFSRQDIRVYNPFSVLYYFEKKQLENYWFASGTPGFLIELLKNQYEDLENLEEAQLTSTSLGTFDIGSLPLISVLFQTGYLTINTYDKVKNKYTLTYPNEEVRESFKKYLLAALSHESVPTVEKLISALSNALKKNDLDSFCTILQTLIAQVPYQLHIPQERYYHSLFQLICSLLDIEAQSEVSTDKGRIDLVIETKTDVYIFEVKLNADADTALRQIEQRRYFERYLIKKKKITLIGLSFSRKKKKKGLFLDWKIKDF